jgi:iron complex outermembrane recepter protein
MNRTDLQVSLSSQQDSNNPNSFYFYTSNASNGYNYGLSLNFETVSNNNFETYMNLGFLKTQINSYTYLTDDSTITEFKSRDAAHAPSYTLSWGFTKFYGLLSIGADVQAKDQFYFSDSHNMKSEAYSIANIHMDYIVNSNFNISIWSKNIFNSKYATRGFFFGLEPPNYENKLYLSYGDPFTIGITLDYKF